MEEIKMLQKPKLGEAKYNNMGSLKNITKNLKPRSVVCVYVGGGCTKDDEQMIW